MRGGATTVLAGAALCVPVVSAVIMAGPRPDAWAASQGGAYPALTAVGADGSSAGTAKFGVLGFPSATITTTSTKPGLSSGNGAFLGLRTPFGALFGSSRGKPYYTLYTAAGRAASVTTVTFASPAPAGGWGFALGDIDADTVRVAATGAGGGALPIAGLGFRGPFQYCHDSPKPPACLKDKSNDDEPTWDAGTGTLVGNGADTYGASGWFVPTEAVKRITLTYDVLTGIPAYQLWMAARKTRITGCVEAADGDRLTGATVRLLDAGGRPVRRADGRPATATSDGDGVYGFDAVAPARYRLSFTPPAGYTADDLTRTVDARAEDPAKVGCFSAAPARKAPDFTVQVTPDTTTPVDGPLTTLAGHGTVSISSPPAHGVARVAGSTIEYRPDHGFRGDDHIDYCLRVRSGGLTCGHIRILVAPNGCRTADRSPLPADSLGTLRYPAAPAQRRC